MAAVDLLFGGPPLTQPANLVFGDDGSNPIVDGYVAGSIALPRPAISGRTRLGIRAGGTTALPRPSLVGETRYATDTQRPLVGRNVMRFQESVPSNAGVEVRQQDATRLPRYLDAHFKPAPALQRSAEEHWQDSLRAFIDNAARFQDGLRAQRAALFRYQDARKAGLRRDSRFQDGVTKKRGAESRMQDALRLRNQAAVRFQDGLPYFVFNVEQEGYGKFIAVGKSSRYQEAIRPPHGLRPTVQPPEEDPCYLPDANLVFRDALAASGDLLFYCERHPPVDPEEPGDTVVVPIKRVYVVLNESSLRRVEGNIHIPTFGMSLSIDADSWTWGFEAEVPMTEEANLEPSSYGDPVELELKINGVPYRVLVESMTRSREFARSTVRISGRGKSAVLDSPYAPTMTFGGYGAFTAQQLMGQVLMLNGVELGWDVEWNLTDWDVPAGVFSHQGSYISALDAIAKAAGGYLQPVPTAQGLRVLSRYPTLPRDWVDVVPDFELPAAVTTREGIEWLEKARYNRVYVSGAANGKIGRVTIDGTAGDLIAPQVVDPLLTHVDALRQRGISVLADTGRQAHLSLRLPVLAETGVITPGKFVRYVDGGVERVGIVRKTGVEIGTPEIWQTLGVETHVLSV